MRNSMTACFYVFALCIAVFPATARADLNAAPAPNLNLPLVEIRETFPPYASFCKRNQGHCEMVGPAIVELGEELALILFEVNETVNNSINSMLSDNALYDQEEYWTYPTDGYGDCEDISLEKRRRLVERGLPRASMTMAIVHHKEMLFSHGVLLVETTSGTYLLNSFTNNVVLWSEAPYNFEMRERLDGTWEVYDQSLWTFM